MPVSFSASNALGVTTRRPLEAATRSRRPRRTAARRWSRPSRGRRRAGCRTGSRRQRRSTISAEPSMPGLDRADEHVVAHRLDLRDDDVGDDRSMAVTPRLFCAVTAVTTHVPHTPCDENAARSAAMPAPPDESTPAIVSATGGFTARVPSRAGRRCAPPMVTIGSPAAHVTDADPAFERRTPAAQCTAARSRRRRTTRRPASRRPRRARRRAPA